MTLPVIPGPFSGLQQAGQVIGESLAKKRAMSIEDEARARAALTTLGQLGILTSDAMAGPQFAETFAAANVPQPTPQQVKPDVEAQKGRKLMELLAQTDPNSTFGKMLIGAPTGANVSEDQMKEYIATFVTEAAKSDPAIARLITKTPTAEIAKATETTQLGALSAEQLGNQVRTEIRESVLRRLPKDKEFARLADYAEIGALGVLVSHIQASSSNRSMMKQESIERMRGLLQINDHATREYRERLNKWNAERAKFHDPTELSILKPGYERMKEEEKQAVQQQLLDLHTQQNPKPSFDAILEEQLGARGVGAAEFQTAMRDLLGLAKESGIPELGGVQGGSGSTAPGGVDQMIAITVQNIVDGKASLEDLEGSTKLTKQQKDEIRRLVAARPKK
jgi:hypothetical protein